MPDQYTIDFEVYGAALPIDEILVASPPASEFESWKAGQALTNARLAKTSGIGSRLPSGWARSLPKKHSRAFSTSTVASCSVSAASKQQRIRSSSVAFFASS